MWIVIAGILGFIGGVVSTLVILGLMWARRRGDSFQPRPMPQMDDLPSVLRSEAAIEDEQIYH
jgi:hypothetical protein